MRRFAISGYPHCQKCGISNRLATALLTKRFVGPVTFLAAWNFMKLLALLASISKSLRSDIVSKAFDWYNWSWYFATFNYIQILSIYEHSRDQDSLLLTWISNHMPSVGLNYLFIAKLQVLHLWARFSDSICEFNIRTWYSDSIFGLDIQTRY